MRFYTKKRRQPSIVIVSMIDILAILLIFFIVTTTFRKTQPQLQINLPESKSAELAPAHQTEPLLLQVKDARAMTFDGQPIGLEELPRKLAEARKTFPNRPIAMQADRDAPFGAVVQVLDALKQAGVQNIPAFTQPPAQQVPLPEPL